jgi:lipoprotein-anchoring transpeptidase ErfK/SrfK
MNRGARIASELLSASISVLVIAPSVGAAPDGNLRVQAQSAENTSSTMGLGVQPVVSVSLGPVFLFGSALVSGEIHPPVDGSIWITLLRGESVAARREVPVGAGVFSESFTIERPGTYRAEAAFIDVNHLQATAVTAPRTTPLPRLKEGSRGTTVRLLEERLRQLRYRVPSPNQRFDYRTADAVLAFRKVQGMPRTKTVTAATWRAMAMPKVPRPRARSPRSHIEVDQTRQVLYVVRGGEIAHILHVSTGGPGVGVTRDGVWRVWLKFPGYSPKGLFMPSFFDGGRAIHGWPDVPPTPASHGCVRVANWVAPWIYRQISVGSQVRIYHS